MRKDVTFSEQKLTVEEFSKKYWRNGEAPYQYHTGNIEDGRDEREQFMFNNIRAVWERMKAKSREEEREMGKIWKEILDNERKIKKLTFIVTISLALVIIALWNKRG